MRVSIQVSLIKVRLIKVRFIKVRLIKVRFIKVRLIKVTTQNCFSRSSLSVMQATLLISVQSMILQVDFLTASQRFIGSSSNIESSVSLRTVHITTATLISTMESIPAGIRRVL